MKRALAVAAAVVVAFAITPPATSAEDAIVFTGVTVLDGRGGSRDDATIVVSGGQITFGGAPAGARRVSVDGAMLSPGFVEAACRTGYAHAEAEITREMTALVDAADLADRTSRDFEDAILEGCTTVVLVPGPRNLIGGLSQAFHSWTPRDRAEPIADSPKALYGAVSSTPSAGNFPPRSRATTSIYARRPTTRMGVVWMLRHVFLSAKGEQEESNDADLTPYREVLDGTRKLHLHAHRLQDVTAALRIADEAGFQFVLDGGEEAYLGRDRLAERGVPVIAGPLPDIRTGSGPDWTDTALRNATMLHESGVTVALTAATHGGRWLREQAMFAVRFGLSKDDALAAITSVPADLCGLDDRGRIADGAAADVVLWSGHPLLPSSRALMVIVNGEVVLDRTEEK